MQTKRRNITGKFSKEKKLRVIFALGAVLLLAAEIYIGLFVKDAFIRPYFGDTLVVVLLYCIVRTVFPRKLPLLSAGIFVFAVFVEVTQIFPLCDLLHIQNRLLRTLMGTSFSWHDILAYLAGCSVTAVIDQILWHRCAKE